MIPLPQHIPGSPEGKHLGAQGCRHIDTWGMPLGEQSWQAWDAEDLNVDLCGYSRLMGPASKAPEAGLCQRAPLPLSLSLLGMGLPSPVQGRGAVGSEAAAFTQH